MVRVFQTTVFGKIFERKTHRVNQPFTMTHKVEFCGVRRPVGIVWIVAIDGLVMCLGVQICSAPSI